ncbi:MAG: hypothetical protein H6618_05580 [Deltaproteobacteria bacterium]|nr:hypothetical protein [Deltaproteobacteria bacterium]
MFRNLNVIHRWLFLSLISGVALQYGCGRDQNDQPEKHSSHQETSATELSAARWDHANNPSLLDTLAGRGYIYNYQQLPSSGSLSREPWSGGYWPSWSGGLSYRWALPESQYSFDDPARYGYALWSRYDDFRRKDLSFLSPLEKLDLLLGYYDFRLTRQERERTQVMKTIPGSGVYTPGYEIPYWEGLCHAWAPATLAFTEPGPVTVESRDGLTIPFGSSDLKGLLVYALHHLSAQNYILARRCNSKSLEELKNQYIRHEISYDQYFREKKACLDTNAGAFHIVLSNQIGLLNEGIIVDIDAQSDNPEQQNLAEVWNQAVYAYESRVLRRREGEKIKKKAAPGTVLELKMLTTMYYTHEVNYSWSPLRPAVKTHKEYKYWLEIDKDGNIVGGSWPTQKSQRPDFIWKQKTPEFSGYFDVIRQLYELSRQQNPARTNVSS